VYVALAAIDQALEQALTARTERAQRWQLTQLRGACCCPSRPAPQPQRQLRRLIRLVRTR